MASERVLELGFGLGSGQFVPEAGEPRCKLETRQIEMIIQETVRNAFQEGYRANARADL